MLKPINFLFIIILLLASCVSITRQPSETKTVPRTIILDNKTFSEEDVGGFTSWYCYDFLHEEKGILLEFGYFNYPEFNVIMGFVLYDGGNTGELTFYQRNGTDHKWDWGPNANYSFVIKPNGTGYYYDFTNVEKGQSIKPKDLYKCYKR
jgi:hypothetical protein